MRTANLMHEVKCAASGCSCTALVVRPKAGDVKGYCVEHLDLLSTNTANYLTKTEVALILSLVKQSKRVTTSVDRR